uniref:Putative secreted protein n=1 Tax=Nyssomyia neivai TaxID=330878 RepID=A0A1L8DNE8_9DIPT
MAIVVKIILFFCILQLSCIFGKLPDGCDLVKECKVKTDPCPEWEDLLICSSPIVPYTIIDAPCKIGYKRNTAGDCRAEV